MEAGGFRLQGLALGSAADPAVQFTGTGTNDGIFSPGNDRVAIATAGVTRMEILAGGIVYIGADATPANASMTTGLTIDQGAADNEILAFQSSDVAHGMTALTSTDTFGIITKGIALEGGVFLAGFSEGNVANALYGYVTTADATRSTAANAPVVVNGLLRSGTGSTTLGANQNIFVVADNSTVRFILDSDGDSHQDAGRTLRAAGGAADDAGVGWTNYDAVDDVAMLNAIAVSLAPADDPLRQAFLTDLERQRDLINLLPGKPLVAWNDGPGQDGHAFLNMSRLTMLHTGAIRQLGQRFNQIERALQAAGIALVA